MVRWWAILTCASISVAALTPLACSGSSSSDHGGGGAKVANAGRAGSGGSSVVDGGGTAGTAALGEAGQATGGELAGQTGGTAGKGSLETAGGSGGTSAGSGGTSAGSCRRYATEFTVNPTGSLQTWRCAFDRASLTMTCTSDRGDVNATTWPTIEDAIGENQPIGLRRAKETKQSNTASSDKCRISRQYQYDSSGRLSAIPVTIDPPGACITSEVAYDAWDADRRPTHGTEHSTAGLSCSGGELSLTYDDALRTITTVSDGGTGCVTSTTVVNHDENGIRTSSETPNASLSISYNTIATAELCN